MRLALDTNAYCAFVAGDSDIAGLVRRSQIVALPVVVLGELKAGFANGSRREENERILTSILATKRVRVLSVTEATSAIYGTLWSDLRKRGRPLPTNDVWIAAQCLEADLPLLTRDTHFQAIPDLRVVP